MHLGGHGLFEGLPHLRLVHLGGHHILEGLRHLQLVQRSHVEENRAPAVPGESTGTGGGGEPVGNQQLEKKQTHLSPYGHGLGTFTGLRELRPEYVPNPLP